MTTSEKVDKFTRDWDGKYDDFDGAYGAQCKDLFSRFNRDVVGNPNYISGNAYQLFDAAPSSVYEKIKNTPSGVPQKGDIVIWNEGIGKYGHVAVFIEGDTKRFKSFDQNFPIGSKCHFQEHTYKAVTGWLRAKSFSAPTPPPPPPPPPTDPCASVKSELEDYKELLRRANVRINDLETAPAQVVEKTVTVEVPVEKIVEKPVEVEKIVEKEVTPKWLQSLVNFFGNLGGKK